MCRNLLRIHPRVVCCDPRTIRRVQRESVLGLIGSGNMASAMVDGWVRADPERASRIVVSDRGSGRARRLAESHGVSVAATNRELVERSEIIVMAVKPIDVERVLREVSGLITPERVGAVRGRRRLHVDARDDRRRERPGLPLHAQRRRARLRRHAGVRRGPLRRRTRPRRACSTGSRQLGTVVRLEERLFDAATALAGSGPAFLGLIVEAFEDAGIVSGLSAAKARELIVSTMVGTAGLLDEFGMSCSDLRRTVTSPGGTAAAGLAQMERAGVRSGIIDGVLAAMRRASELG